MATLAHDRPDHDELLIARLAAGDLTAAEVSTAQALVARCSACAELHADLVSIRTATAGLPVPRRTRDFQLTAADATRLHPAGWRRFLGGFGTARLAFSRPLAGGLVALGLAGLLVSAGPGLLNSAGSIAAFGSAGAAAPQVATSQDSAASRAPAGGAGEGSLSSTAAGEVLGPKAVSSAAPATSATPAGSALPAESVGPVASIDQQALAGQPAGAPSPAGIPSPAGGADWLVIGSLAVLVLGLGLFMLRWVGRRS